MKLNKIISLVKRIQFKRRIRKFIAHNLLNKEWIHVDDFHAPYIISKKCEGVTFLFHIRDKHARLWYDIYSGGEEWKEMAFIRDNLIIPGSTVIECGSHHGMTAILLSSWLGDLGHVYGYEPGIVNYGILKENLELNNVKNVTAINAACGANNGFVYFDENREHSMGSSVSTNVNKFSSRKVDLVSLDNHINESPTLVKIDTQGYVYQPLLGMSNLIRVHRPNLAIEIDGRKAISRYGDNFEAIFELINHDFYDYYVSFKSSDYPELINLKDVIPRWIEFNNCTGDIHLFAKNLSLSKVL